MHGGHPLPGAILSAAVDVGAVIHQVLDDGEPAAGARLVQGAVAGIVSVVHVTHSVLQAVEDHLLKTGKHTHTEGESWVQGLWDTGTRSLPVLTSRTRIGCLR